MTQTTLEKPINIYLLEIMRDRLRGIRIENGYPISVKSAEIGSLTPLKGYDIPAIRLWADGVSSDKDGFGFETRILSISVDGYGQDENFQLAADVFGACIQVAIHRGVSAPLVSDASSYDLGGLVSYVNLDNIDYAIGEGQKPWYMVRCAYQVGYRTENGLLFDI